MAGKSQQIVLTNTFNDFHHQRLKRINGTHGGIIISIHDVSINGAMQILKCNDSLAVGDMLLNS